LSCFIFMLLVGIIIVLCAKFFPFVLLLVVLIFIHSWVKWLCNRLD